MSEPRSIPIRLRTVVDEEGDHDSLEPLVHCPRRSKSIDGRTCVGCARMRSMQWDPKKGGEVVCAPNDGLPMRPPAPRADVTEAAARTPLHDVAELVTVCVRPGATIESVRKLFVERGLRAAPVVDGDVRLVGVISRSDLLKAKPDAIVRDVVGERVHALPEHAPLGYAVALMAFENISEVPVVTDTGELVGMWTALQAMQWMAEKMGYVKPA
jgi:CBS domain-containing protein